MVIENLDGGESSIVLSSEAGDLILRSKKKVKRGRLYTSSPMTLPWNEGLSFVDTLKGVGRTMRNEEEGFMEDDMHRKSRNIQNVMVKESESEVDDFEENDEEFSTFLEDNSLCPKVRVFKKEKRHLRTP